MRLIDVNLLLYAVVRSYPQYPAMHDWLKSALRGPARVGLPWSSLLGFVRLTCRGGLFDQTMSVPEAWQHVEAWLDCPTVWVPVPTERHREVLGALLTQAPSPKLVMDADLAALAIEHGLILCSADRDFGRFSGLRWENPLA